MKGRKARREPPRASDSNSTSSWSLRHAWQRQVSSPCPPKCCAEKTAFRSNHTDSCSMENRWGSSLSGMVLSVPKSPTETGQQAAGAKGEKLQLDSTALSQIMRFLGGMFRRKKKTSRLSFLCPVSACVSPTRGGTNREKISREHRSHRVPAVT